MSPTVSGPTIFIEFADTAANDVIPVSTVSNVVVVAPVIYNDEATILPNVISPTVTPALNIAFELNVDSPPTTNALVVESDETVVAPALNAPVTPSDETVVAPADSAANDVFPPATVSIVVFVEDVVIYNDDTVVAPADSAANNVFPPATVSNVVFVEDVVIYNDDTVVTPADNFAKLVEPPATVSNVALVDVVMYNDVTVVAANVDWLVTFNVVPIVTEPLVASELSVVSPAVNPASVD